MNILSFLQNLIKNDANKIEEWFSVKRKMYKPFIYNSVDIRFSGQKIVPVDTNIFPAGFNNLSEKARNIAALEMQNFCEENLIEGKKALLIVEFHTRNLKYLENVNSLKNIFNQAGFEVKCGYFKNAEAEEVLELEDALGKIIILYPLERQDDKVLAGEFIADLIIVNNDLTLGAPEILQNITQPIFPPTGMGWYRRTKHNHFLAYNNIAKEFAKEFGFDPFFITTELDLCKDISFKERKGLECLVKAIDKVLFRLNDKYSKFGIEQEPYIYLKANRGTYGMGIMIVKKSEDILELNKKNRNKMNVIKNNTKNEEILIQEGVVTEEKYLDNACESFIYLVNGRAVGSILRVNGQKDNEGNLNSKGAEFVSSDELVEFQENIEVYKLVAELAALASSAEIAE